MGAVVGAVQTCLSDLDVVVAHQLDIDVRVDVLEIGGEQDGRGGVVELVAVGAFDEANGVEGGETLDGEDLVGDGDADLVGDR